MAYENTSHKVLEPVEATIKRIAKLINILLTNIDGSKVTIDHFEVFLDWFLDLSSEECEEIFMAHWQSPLPLLSEGKSLKLSALKGTRLICNMKQVFDHIDFAI